MCHWRKGLERGPWPVYAAPVTRTTTMEPKIEQTLYLTAEEAIAHMKRHRAYRTTTHKGTQTRKARTFFIMASIELPVQDNPDSYFPGRHCIKVDFASAVDTVRNTLSGSFEARGGRIKCHLVDGCYFIGGF